MADGGTLSSEDVSESGAGRPDRKALVCFTVDAETEQAVRDGLSGVSLPSAVYQRGDVRKAIAMLRETPTPWALVVDISGHPQPFVALEELSGVVEPDVRVLVVGDRQDLGFYRHLTRSLGVADYLYKPLTPAMVAENFAPILQRRRDAQQRARGGRLISVTGARGGMGASTVAVNLACYLANVANRHTVILDADMHRGTVPLLLNLDAAQGLRSALEHPERVDELFVERSAITAGERLHVLASEEPLAKDVPQREGAATHLISMLRRRYTLIVADAPFAGTPVSREVLDAAQQRVIVLEPTLAGVRDTLRLMQLPAGPGQAHRPIIVLNRSNRKGALPLARVEETLRMKPDLVLPDLPGAVENAATMGQPALDKNRAFARGIALLARATTGIGGKADAPAKRGLFGLLRR
jgi:pilus assembly protein CpaE